MWWNKSTATQILNAETQHIKVAYPSLFEVLPKSEVEGLDQLEGRGEVDLILALKKFDKASFRPNLVFTSAADSSPLMDAATAAYVAAFKENPGTRLFEIHGWSSAAESLADIPIGRTMCFTYSLAGRDIVVQKWVVATGKHHLHFTASYLPSQALFYKDIFEQIMGSVEFNAPAKQLTAVAVQESEHGVKLDKAATAEVETFPIEDVSWIENPGPLTGKVLETPEVDSFAKENGISEAQLLKIVVTHGETVCHYIAHWGAYGVVVVRSAGPDLFHPVEDKYSVYRLDPENLLSDALAWIKLHPVFAFKDLGELSYDEYKKKVTSPEEPTNWVDVKIISAQDRAFAFSYVPDAGLCAVSPVGEDTLEIGTVPPIYVIETMTKIIEMGFENLAG